MIAVRDHLDQFGDALPVVVTFTDDTRQLGADAIIKRDGRLVRVWLPPSPNTRPSIDAIVDAVNESEG